jgi:hypothetical protein
VTPCASNLQGTWLYQTACGDDPLADFRQFCASVTLVSSSSTLSGRIDFVASAVARRVTTSFNTSVNLPTSCASVGCSTIQSLLQQSVPTATCVTAAGGRTGCDCTVSGSSTLDEAGTFTADGGVVTVTTAQRTRTFDTCVAGGTLQVRETTANLPGTEKGTSTLTHP